MVGSLARNTQCSGSAVSSASAVREQADMLCPDSRQRLFQLLMELPAVGQNLLSHKVSV